MEEIIIPNYTEIELATMDTVDKFASLAEALSTVQDETFLSESVFILKKISKQPKDVGEIFDTLGKVIMLIVSERMKDTEWTSGRLPDLERPKRQALNPCKTFHDDFNLEEKTKQVGNLLKEHQRKLKKCRSFQQECFTTTKKLSQKDLQLFIAQRSRGYTYLAKPGTFTNKNLAARDKKIKKLKEKVSDRATYRENVHLTYSVYAVDELFEREKLKKLSKELVKDIEYEIKERVTHGIECLHNTITEHMHGESQDECQRLIRGINKDNVASSLLQATARKYTCPDIMEYHENYGFHTALPDGVVVDASASLKDSITVQKAKSTVTVENDDTAPLPGLLKLRKGTKIKQRFVTDNDLAFGFCKSNVFSPKVWGFYYRHVTQAN